MVERTKNHMKNKHKESGSQFHRSGFFKPTTLPKNRPWNSVCIISWLLKTLDWEPCFLHLRKLTWNPKMDILEGEICFWEPSLSGWKANVPPWKMTVGSSIFGGGGLFTRSPCSFLLAFCDRLDFFRVLQPWGFCRNQLRKGFWRPTKIWWRVRVVDLARLDLAAKAWSNSNI